MSSIESISVRIAVSADGGLYSASVEPTIRFDGAPLDAQQIDSIQAMAEQIKAAVMVKTGEWVKNPPIEFKNGMKKEEIPATQPKEAPSTLCPHCKGAMITRVSAAGNKYMKCRNCAKAYGMDGIELPGFPNKPQEMK